MNYFIITAILTITLADNNLNKTPNSKISSDPYALTYT